MEIRYNVTGERRKEMVAIIGQTLGEKPVYMKVPTCAYRIGGAEVTKEGTLVCGDLPKVALMKVIESLAKAGFKAENGSVKAELEKAEKETEQPQEEPESPEEAENVAEEPAPKDCLTISLPRKLFTGEALENLQKLLIAKGTIIRKALGIGNLPLEVDDEKISFPWFTSDLDAEEIKAYTLFIQKLGEMARNQKRITAKEKEIVNEKYEFRCFLLRLGLIGSEYKAARKILLSNLSGSAAFRNGQPAGGEEA
jgi:hypothetical protein